MRIETGFGASKFGASPFFPPSFRSCLPRNAPCVALHSRVRCHRPTSKAPGPIARFPPEMAGGGVPQLKATLFNL